MSKGQSLQDPFLNALRKERVPVSIFLVNGIKLQGQIESFDQFVVLLKNTVSQMVYKHAISTVVPSRVVRLPMQNPPEEGGGGRCARPWENFGRGACRAAPRCLSAGRGNSASGSVVTGFRRRVLG